MPVKRKPNAAAAAAADNKAAAEFPIFKRAKKGGAAATAAAAGEIGDAAAAGDDAKSAKLESPPNHTRIRLMSRADIALAGIDISQPLPPLSPPAAAASAAAASAVDSKRSDGVVVYWMSRDQRVDDNWSLLTAQYFAERLKCPLIVVFCLVPSFLGATIRHYGFMLSGLAETEAKLRSLAIPMYVLSGAVADALPPFVQAHGVRAVVSDFSPLRIAKMWQQNLSAALNPLRVPLYQVDAHNIVPCWRASPHQEYAARTIRPKLNLQLAAYLTSFPPVKPNAYPLPHALQHAPAFTGFGKMDSVKVKSDVAAPAAAAAASSTAAAAGGSSTAVAPAVAGLPASIDWAAVRAGLTVDTGVAELTKIKAGSAAGNETLRSFFASRLKRFAESRNDPTVDVASGVSPYLHFGQLSAQRCVLNAQPFKRAHSSSVASFVEELFIRRELSDNFCYYNDNYDNLNGAAGWARESLNKHATDKREHLYSLARLEHAVTYDDLWNAAQLQMVRDGKMHGFLRMYWAKKILEWTESPAQALQYSIYLNDRFSIDGRDPNGYVGCAWSIMGIHDIGWAERTVFGKIRFMNYAGCKRKFNVSKFVASYPAATPQSTQWKANKAKAEAAEAEAAAAAGAVGAVKAKDEKPKTKSSAAAAAAATASVPEPKVKRESSAAAASFAAAAAGGQPIGPDNMDDEPGDGDARDADGSDDDTPLVQLTKQKSKK